MELPSIAAVPIPAPDTILTAEAVPADSGLFRSGLLLGPVNIAVPVPERESQAEGCVPPPLHAGSGERRDPGDKQTVRPAAP